MNKEPEISKTGVKMGENMAVKLNVVNNELLTKLRQEPPVSSRYNKRRTRNRGINLPF